MMEQAASLPLPYPEVAVVDEPSLPEQSLALALHLPERPLVLGGCCCAHLGAVEGLVARHERLAVVWLDAHGDLNSLETSPSGDLWGTPLRLLLESGAVRAQDVALVGARELDPGEQQFLYHSDVHVGAAGVERALAGADGVYVALDSDSLDAHELASFMPEPGGLSLDEVEALFEQVAVTAPVVGAGISGLAPEPRNVGPLARLCASLGL